MNGNSFTSQMRRRALRAEIVGYFWMIVIAIGLVPWGLYFLLGRCDDCTGWNVGGIIIGLCMEGGSAGLVWYMVREIRKRMAPGSDPVTMQLKAYGDLASLALQIDTDFAGQALRKNRFYLSRRWLVSGSGEVHIVHVDALVWAYPETIRHKLNGIIPIGTTHQLAVWERSGRGVGVKLKKREVEGALKAVAEAAPWILLGYTETIKESWNNDREDLLASVERRKKELDGASR